MKNKANKKLTVTIGIPAYNEEINIERLLISLLNQKHDKFILKNIVVYSDAGTDKTCDIVESLREKFSSIKLIRGNERKGKYFRVNQAFRNCKSDILVILDADIALVGKSFLNDLINRLIIDPNAQMVAAHQKPIRPKNFIGKIIHTNFVLWDFVRLSIPDHETALTFSGAATAYRGSFARSINIDNMFSDPELFIYLKAAKIRGFRYCPKAEVLHWSISTIDDLNKFLRRSIGKGDEKLKKMFGENIEKVYSVPLRYKLLGILKCFIWQPFYTPFALVLSLFMAQRVKTIKADKSPVWETITSTKKPI